MERVLRRNNLTVGRTGKCCGGTKRSVALQPKSESTSATNLRQSRTTELSNTARVTYISVSLAHEEDSPLCFAPSVAIGVYESHSPAQTTGIVALLLLSFSIKNGSADMIYGQRISD